MTDVPEEFVDLLTTHQGRLQSYIASLLQDPEATWDVLQETNRVLIERRDKFEMGTSFLNWALTVAQFQTMAWLRDQKRDRHILTPGLVELISRESLAVSLKNHDVRLAALEICMERLPQEKRELIRCRYGRGDSLAEISNRTAKSVNGLKQIFYRIRKRLMSCVEEQLEML